MTGKILVIALVTVTLMSSAQAHQVCGQEPKCIFDNKKEAELHFLQEAITWRRTNQNADAIKEMKRRLDKLEGK